ncbi:MAG: hypothetical protein AAFR03_07830 [Pseudomonadota bacterium]
MPGSTLWACRTKLHWSTDRRQRTGYKVLSEAAFEGRSLTLNSYQEYRERMSMARIYAGAHFRTSNDHGEEVGRRAAEIVVETLARPLE